MSRSFGKGSLNLHYESYLDLFRRSSLCKLRTLAATAGLTAVATFGDVALPPVAGAVDPECSKDAIIGVDGYTTAWARCGRIQHDNREYRIHVDLFRKSDGTDWNVNGEWRDCNSPPGRRSDVTWITKVYVWVDWSIQTRLDTDGGTGC